MWRHYQKQTMLPATVNWRSSQDRTRKQFDAAKSRVAQSTDDRARRAAATRRRRAIAGRKKDPQLESTLLKLVEPHTAGDPMSSRKWMNCRLSDIQECLGKHEVSKPVISRLLKAHNYRLQANAKQICSKQDPERNLQFEHIQEQRQQHQEAGEPHISTDTKKKELIGNFKNPGQVWCQAAERVHAHDFKQDSLGSAVPYGVYDLQFNRGTVYLGWSADTPAFATDNIAAWCATERLERFPTSRRLMIETDCGGSNSAVSRAWKYHLQNKVADRFCLIITVCHYPTGASKRFPRFGGWIHVLLVVVVILVVLRLPGIA
jgi:hypothetical protein